MSTRTVRLDEEAEQTLTRLRDMTGLSISEVLKEGLNAFESTKPGQAQPTPIEVFRQLDLGEGGYAATPARDAKHAIGKAIQRKHRR